MILLSPWYVIILAVVLAVVIWAYFYRCNPALRFPNLDLISSLPLTWRVRFSAVPAYLKILGLTLALIALCRPVAILQLVNQETEGIDIVLALDASGSMAAEDFSLNGQRMNRFDVIKNVVNEFIDQRSSDRVGIIAFAGLAYTVSPLTLDHNWSKTSLGHVVLNSMPDGTAIGSAIASGLSRLKKSSAKSRVMILLTDGINNRGKIDPLTAAKAAAALGVKIYTIGAGTNGYAPFPVQSIWGQQLYQNVPVEIDEATLQKIALDTGAKYYRATDTQTLREIYKDIDRLEKTKINQTQYRDVKELFPLFLLAAIILLGLALIVENTIFAKLP